MACEENRHAETKDRVQCDRDRCHLEGQDERMHRRWRAELIEELMEARFERSIDDRADRHADEHPDVDGRDDADQPLDHRPSSGITNRRRASDNRLNTTIVMRKRASETAAAACRSSLSISP